MRTRQYATSGKDTLGRAAWKSGALPGFAQATELSRPRINTLLSHALKLVFPLTTRQNSKNEIIIMLSKGLSQIPPDHIFEVTNL